MYEIKKFFLENFSVKFFRKVFQNGKEMMIKYTRCFNMMSATLHEYASMRHEWVINGLAK